MAMISYGFIIKTNLSFPLSRLARLLLAPPDAGCPFPSPASTVIIRYEPPPRSSGTEEEKELEEKKRGAKRRAAEFFSFLANKMLFRSLLKVQRQVEEFIGKRISGSSKGIKQEEPLFIHSFIRTGGAEERTNN